MPTSFPSPTCSNLPNQLECPKGRQRGSERTPRSTSSSCPTGTAFAEMAGTRQPRQSTQHAWFAELNAQPCFTQSYHSKSRRKLSVRSSSWTNLSSQLVRVALNIARLSQRGRRVILARMFLVLPSPYSSSRSTRTHPSLGGIFSFLTCVSRFLAYHLHGYSAVPSNSFTSLRGP